MPDQKDLKRLIRVRMRRTGESYTTARAQVLKQPGSTSVTITFERRDSPAGPVGFLQIIEATVREARVQGADEVLPEHLLVALLATHGSRANRVLTEANLFASTIRRELFERRGPRSGQGR